MLISIKSGVEPKQPTTLDNDLGELESWCGN